MRVLPKLSAKFFVRICALTGTAAMVLLALSLSAHAGQIEFSFNQGGLKRDFILYTPDSVAAAQAPVPLVMVLHGGGGNSRQMVRATRRQFNRLADQHGAVTVYPNAIDGTWDFGAGKVSQALEFRRDDLLYLTTVIAHLLRTWPIDGDRIFATGISRGGQASYFLACKRPDLIRAIAPVAMSLPEFMTADCRAKDVAIAVLNGTADPLVPYDGGQITILRQTRGAVLSTDATMAFFARRNGCDALALQSRIGGVLISDWTDCRARTRLYRIEDGGHTWPGGASILPHRLVGATNTDIDATGEIWGFFSQF